MNNDGKTIWFPLRPVATGTPEQRLERGVSDLKQNFGVEQMEDHDRVKERETVIVERGSGGGVIAAIALLILVLGVLAYLGLLPF